jgi:hypothetical protein
VPGEEVELLAPGPEEDEEPTGGSELEEEPGGGRSPELEEMLDTLLEEELENEPSALLDDDMDGASCQPSPANVALNIAGCEKSFHSLANPRASCQNDS